jgi:hypothetical protein
VAPINDDTVERLQLLHPQAPLRSLPGSTLMVLKWTMTWCARCYSLFTRVPRQDDPVCQ